VKFQFYQIIKYEYRIIEAEMKNHMFDPVANEDLLTGHGLDGFHLLKIEKDVYLETWYYLEKQLAE